MSREGSVKRDDSGRWGFVVDLTPPGAAKRRQIRRRGFRTKALAIAELDELKAQLRTGRFAESTRLTFGTYLREWLAGRPAAGLKPSTVDSYRRSVDAYVIRRPVADVPLQSLTAVDLDRLYAEILTGGARDGGALSPRSVRYVHTILRKALADAGRKRLVMVNVADDADPPRASSTRPPRPTIWSPAELAAFLGHVAGHHQAALIRLAAMTGLRRAELCGLRWSAVDLDAARLTVLHIVTAVSHRRVAGTPKTERGVRVVDLDERTVGVLRAHRARQLEQRLLLGAGWQDEGWVFAMPDGRCWHPDVVGRAFDRLVASSGVPRIRFHDLRHTHASHLLAAGVNVKVVSERLGHASVAFTLDAYSHVMPGQQAGAAAAAAALVDSL